jgi:hypothetical protein
MQNMGLSGPVRLPVQRVEFLGGRRPLASATCLEVLASATIGPMVG